MDVPDSTRGLDIQQTLITCCSTACQVISLELRFRLLQVQAAAGSTRRVSVGPSFQYSAPFRELGSPFISGDGRYVGFTALTELGALMPQGKGLVRTIIARDMEEERMIWVAENVPALVGSATVRSYNPVIGEDGSHVVFKEEGGRILRYHVESRTTEVIATNAVVNGFTIEGTSGPVLSADGRFMVFARRELVSSSSQVYRWDDASGETILISVNREGTGPGNGISDTPWVSADGRYVTFLSHATDLVEGELNRSSKLHVRDVEMGTTVLLNLSADGEPGVHDLVWPFVSAHAEVTVFDVPDDRYVAGDVNRMFDVFCLPFGDFTADLLNVGLPGTRSVTAFGPSHVEQGSLSADGRYVAFVSQSDDLVSNDANGLPDDGSAPLTRYERDVFLRDVEQGRTILVSRSGSRDQSGDGPSDQVSLSADAGYVAYSSWANDLVAGDQLKQKDVVVFDRVPGLNRLWSVNDAGSGAGWGSSHRPVLSADGGVLVFKSYADDLIALDYNDAADLFWARVDGPGGLNSFFADVRATAGETVTVRWRGEAGLNYRPGCFPKRSRAPALQNGKRSYGVRGGVRRSQGGLFLLPRWRRPV
jgi:hypothetical protein